MIDFPQNTQVNKRIPKEAFYKHLELSAALKRKFISDIESITVAYSLTSKNLNLTTESQINEILLLSIWVKAINYEKKLIEEIARQNQHKLLFKISNGDNVQLAVYCNRFYCSEWMNVDKLALSLHGNTLDEIWENLVRPIAITSAPLQEQTWLTLEEQLQRQNEISRLTKLINKTEKAVWKERQPKKSFELYTVLHEYKNQLEDIINGND
ncbi:MAG: DUF4391 domain-containing protein [Succinivibrionaceae bacterium]